MGWCFRELLELENEGKADEVMRSIELQLMDCDSQSFGEMQNSQEKQFTIHRNSGKKLHRLEVDH